MPEKIGLCAKFNRHIHVLVSKFGEHKRSQKGCSALGSNDHPINTIQYNTIQYNTSEQYKQLSSSFRSTSLLAVDILFGISISNNFTLRFFITVSDHVFKVRLFLNFTYQVRRQTKYYVKLTALRLHFMSQQIEFLFTSLYHNDCFVKFALTFFN